MKSRIITSTIFWAYSLFVSAQYVVKSTEELNSLKKLPQEKVYIDHTGPLLFSGEYLYYAFYTFNAQNNRRSDISRIGYVALINEAKEYILEQKIRLNRGMGQGDFFIGTDIPSGKYKLLAYTQWMKNSGLEQVYKGDIVIINPYMANQSRLLKDTLAMVSNENNVPTNELTNTKVDSSTISISIGKQQYGLRKKVKLTIKNYKGYLGNGVYTLKVQKKEDIPVKSKLDAIDYAVSYFGVDKQIPQKVGDSLFLPEQRGELFFGSVKDSLTNEPIKGAAVVLSIPGKEFLLKFARTDENGNFYSYLRKNYKDATAVVQIENQDQAYKITKGKMDHIDLSDLTFANFKLSKTYEDAIKNRSVLNQIENQFFTIKPDSVIQGDVIDPFDGGLPEVVYLDEYTRFPTFEETLIEVVKFAGYRNGEGENDYVKVSQDFETYNEDYNSFPAIVLIDGVYITNHESIKKFDARRIEKISLIRDQFRLGGKDYQGIVAIETFDHDYLKEHTSKNNKIITFDKPIQKKNYYAQQYKDQESASVFSRIPDYRTLLLWVPQLIIDGNSYDFNFYTSDIEGEYEVILNGFTSYGKPITLQKGFSITPTEF